MALNLDHYRFGIDELAESTHGWYAAEDTDPASGVIALDTTFLLRFTMQDVTTAVSNVDANFEYRKNGGAWTQITTTSANVKAVTPTCWANAANTTHRLSGTGTFESSSLGCTADGIAGGAQMDIVANGNAETECALQLVSTDLAGGDLIEFRLTRDAQVALTAYNVVPSITIATDTTAPVLTSQTVGSLTTVGGTPAVTTDEGNGTAYMVVVPNADSPSATQIKAGQNSSGGAALANQNQAVTGTGVQTFSAVTGLTSNTPYDVWFVHTDAATNDSTAVKADFTTALAFDDVRQDILDGVVSAQSETHGLNAEISNIPVTAVTRVSDTVARITFPALSAFDITAQEVVTVTAPGVALVGGSPLVATPTFTIDPAAAAHSITGAITVVAGVVASFLDFVRHAALVGSLVVSAVPSSAMDFTRHHAIAGDVTVSATPASTLAYAKHHALVGDITVSATPAATLLFTQAPVGVGIIGSVTVSATPASTLDFARHAGILGAVTTTSTPAATLNFERHAAIAGDITAAAVPAATLAYTPFVLTFDDIRQDIIDGVVSAQSEAHGFNAERVNIPVTAVTRISDTLVRLTLPALAAYDITAQETITVTAPASALAGGVPIVAAPTVTIDAAAGAGIVGAVTVTATPAASLMDITRYHSISGDVTTTATPAATMAASIAVVDVRQAIIDGLTSAQSEAHGWNAEVRDKIAVTDVVRTSDTVVTITLDAAAAYDITAQETITATIPGSALVSGVPIVASPTFTIDATAGAYSIVGDVTVSATPAATMDVTRHYALSGAVTVTASPSASLMDVTRHHAIIGAVPVSATPSAALEYQRHAAIVGSVLVIATPSSATDFQRHSSIAGAVPVVATPASAMQYTAFSPTPAIHGSVTVTITPAATLDYQMHRSIVGAVAVSAVPSATMAIARYHALIGTVTVTAIPASVTAIGRHPSIVGSVPVAAVPAATMRRILAGSPEIVGSVTVTVVPASESLYTIFVHPPGKYKSEHDSALVDLGAAHGFSSEHASALKDLGDAGI